MTTNGGTNRVRGEEPLTSIKRKFAETFDDCNDAIFVSHPKRQPLLQVTTELNISADKTNVLRHKESVLTTSKHEPIFTERFPSFEKMDISSQESLGGSQSMVISSQENELDQEVLTIQANCTQEKDIDSCGEVDITNQDGFALKKNSGDLKCAEFSGSESVHSSEKMDISSQESITVTQGLVVSNQKAKFNQEITPKKVDSARERNSASCRKTHVSNQDGLDLKVSEAILGDVTSSQEASASHTEEHSCLGIRKKNVSLKKRGILSKKEKCIASREEAVEKRELVASLREKALSEREDTILCREKALLDRETRLFVLLAKRKFSNSSTLKRKKKLDAEDCNQSDTLT